VFSVGGSCQACIGSSETVRQDFGQEDFGQGSSVVNDFILCVIIVRCYKVL
jgi:hypothetical protein